MSKSKTCDRCQCEKPVSEYSRKFGKAGWNDTCKACLAVIAAESNAKKKRVRANSGEVLFKWLDIKPNEY